MCLRLGGSKSGLLRAVRPRTAVGVHDSHHVLLVDVEPFEKCLIQVMPNRIGDVAVEPLRIGHQGITEDAGTDRQLFRGVQ